MTDRLDVATAARALGARWRFVVLCGALGALAGVAAALLLPSRYRASASFQPESQTPALLGAGLAGLASQLGAGALGSQSNPQFYADLVRSRALLLQVAAQRFPSRDGPRPLWDLYGYDDRGENERLQRAADKLSRKVESRLNFRTSVVTFSVEGHSPEMAKALADSMLGALNAFNVRLRRARASAERQFGEERTADARLALARAENALADFNQRNRVVLAPALQVEHERLRRQVDIASQVYLQLRLQAEQAGAQEARSTPALTVVDAPVLPFKRSWPNRRLTVLAGLLAGLLLGAGRVLLLALPRRAREDADPSRRIAIA